MLRALAAHHISRAQQEQSIGGGVRSQPGTPRHQIPAQPFPAEEAAKKLSKVMLTAPLVAPAIGAALLSFGWASIFFFLAVCVALMLLCFTQVPETAVTRIGKFVPSQIFPQYVAVLAFRDHGRLIGLRWILSQGFMSSVMLVFITNSSFIYLQYYGVGEDRFVFFFAASLVVHAFSLMSMSMFLFGSILGVAAG